MPTSSIPVFDAALDSIREKVADGERLSFNDGMTLASTNDLPGLGALANFVRERLHGDKTFYNINRHINYSNVCTAECKFCAFKRKSGEEGAWTYSLEEIYRKVAEDCPPGCTELHIVGGLHPDLPYEYYLDMLRGLRERFPHLHLKAFTAIEMVHLASISRQHVKDVLRQMKDAGLGSMPGGGAEVFQTNTRGKIVKGKANAKGWLNVHRWAHEIGLRTNATLLYGHIESWEDRIKHLLALRELQDETGGFQVFIPLAFHPANTEMDDLPGPSGLTDMKVFSISRLMLDNFANIKAYWIMLGVKMAQILLSFGANDLDGTVTEETIYHMAGAETPQRLSVPELRRMIEEAGRIPVQRDTLYNEIETPAAV